MNMAEISGAHQNFLVTCYLFYYASILSSASYAQLLVEISSILSFVHANFIIAHECKFMHAIFESVRNFSVNFFRAQLLV